MVICAYFVNNMCRFGPKCNNEHVNVRLILKTDAEGVLNGNQWMLSGYSPFRDKPCMPNFIEDQSFEEIRLMAYEARNNGTIQNVTQQLAQSINDARQKMTYLLNPSNDILSLAINLYSGTNTPSNASAMSSAGANPFSIRSMSNTQQNNTSLFGGASSGSAFGSSQPNPFASSVSGFGTSNQTSTNTSTNLFGSSMSTAPANSNSIFGGSSNTNAGSIFAGTSAFSNAGQSGYGAQTSQPSIFGSSTNTNTNAGPFSQGAASSGPFSQTTSVFGGSAQTNAIFGGPPSFGSKPNGIFGQSSTTPSNQSGNIFGQTVQPFGQTVQPFGTTNSQSSIFGGSNQNQNQSMFGQHQPQQQQQQQQQPQTQGGIFGSINNTPSTNIFGNQTGASMGGSAPTNVFGTVQPQPQQQPPNNAFGSSPFQQQQVSALGNNAASNIAFGMASPQTSVAPSLQPFGQTVQPFGTTNSQSSIFGGSNHNQNQSMFGQQQPQQQPQPQANQQQPIFQQVQAAQPLAVNASVYYSVLSDLTDQEVEKFKANEFVLGKIPTKPPPRELCA